MKYLKTKIYQILKLLHKKLDSAVIYIESKFRKYSNGILK